MFNVNELFKFLTSNLGVLTAVIAALTSLLTLIVTLISKNYLEINSIKAKLQLEYSYSQKKSIKETLAKYKTHLLNSGELLNHRLINFETHSPEKWHFVNGVYPSLDRYYFSSFNYRVLRFFAWSEIVSKELIFLDTTIASKEDLQFIKFIKVHSQILQDTALFRDFNYVRGIQKDHFFRDVFDEMPDFLIKDKDVLSFTQYRQIAKKKVKSFDALCNFLDGMSKEEDRLRWDRLICFHLLLATFLNSYGYDFQHTDMNGIKKIISEIKNKEILINFVRILKENNLHNQKNIKKLISLINEIVTVKKYFFWLSV